MLIAARAGNLAEVRRLIESGVPVNSTGEWGSTALALAARAGATDVVEYLLGKGADPNAQEGFFGMTVLDMALWDNGPDYATARQILAAGADDRGGTGCRRTRAFGIAR